MAATWLTMKGFMEDPLSVTLRRAGRSWRSVALLIPWYSRLASLSIRGRRPLLVLASAIQDSRPLRLLERLALEAGLPFTRRELAIMLVSAPLATVLTALTAALAAIGVSTAAGLGSLLELSSAPPASSPPSLCYPQARGPGQGCGG
ncbi:MAG: hypothetical protein F7B17_05740 [Desulfurococcales archaeon]|nr:hypothetical protein [Desulfurococcales archaeon]